MAAAVTILGAGVSGLTTAVVLAEAGYPVKVIARELPAATTSAVAAAIWYPYRVDHPSVVDWAVASLGEFRDLASKGGAGVRLIEALEMFDHEVADPWWRPAVDTFRRAEREELVPGYVDGWVLRVPQITPPVYLDYLAARLAAADGGIVVGAVDSLDELDGTLVNCAGVAAARLLPDPDTYPIRGQVLRVANPGLTRAVLEEHGPLAVTYIIPRGEDCILGGTVDAGAWDREPDDAVTARILANAARLEPRLADARPREVLVGLRPGRPLVRLEREEREVRSVIHNYGHGGSGFTLSWGCARDVLGLLTA